LAVVGGKFTTYRAVAEEVVDRIAARLGSRGPCRTRNLPLPGGDLPWNARVQWEQGAAFRERADALARTSGVESALAAHWLWIYGSRAVEVGAQVAREPALGAPLCPHHPHCRAEVLYAVQAESALELEDWFLRRTHIGYLSCNGRDAVDTVGSIFARALDWPAAREQEAVNACRATLDAVAAEASDRVRSV
jgi:glycerol-3-phosphate dehydrogenase